MSRKGFVAKIRLKNGNPVEVVFVKGNPVEIFMRDWAKVLGNDGFRSFRERGMNKYIGKG